MQITQSNIIKINKTTPGLVKALELTQNIYQEMLEYLIPIANAEWEMLKNIKYSNERMTALQRLIHTTKSNTAIYDFDDRFPKCPSYLRRAALVSAIGQVSSYHSNLQNWTDNGKEGKAPTLQPKVRKAPTFYRDNMFNGLFGRKAQLKLWNGSDWKWFDITVRKSDAEYIDKQLSLGKEMSAPTLRRKGKSWSLCFAFTFDVELQDESLDDGLICAVDLGINNAAVCVIMDKFGTVVARRFIKLAAEEDQLAHRLNRAKKKQRNGARKLKKYNAKTNYINHDISQKTVNAIVAFAVEYSCPTIVCEFLDAKGKISGSKKQRLQRWRKREIYKLLCGKAHASSVHVHQVCAWNTSKLAFDGSGEVQRGRDIVNEHGESLCYSYSWVRFGNGKLYNADLNAAYNIGARYLVSALLKTLEEADKEFRVGGTKRSQVLAKVPELGKRSLCTLSTLINLWAVVPSVS